MAFLQDFHKKKIWQQNPVYLILQVRRFFSAGESEKENRAKLICYDVSRLNKPLIQIRNLTVFSTLPPEDASKMQKRTEGVLHGGFLRDYLGCKR